MFGRLPTSTRARLGGTWATFCSTLVVAIAMTLVVSEPAHATLSYVSLSPNADRAAGGWARDEWNPWDGWCQGTISNLWVFAARDPDDPGDYQGMSCPQGGDGDRVSTGALGATLALELTDPNADVIEATIYILAHYDADVATYGSLSLALRKADGTLIDATSGPIALTADPFGYYEHYLTTSLTAAEANGMYVEVRSESHDGEIALGGLKVNVTTATWDPPDVVRDGTASDIDGTTDGTTLQANWTTVVHPKFSAYEYCFSATWDGSDCAGAAFKPWTSTTATTGSASPLALSSGTTAYSCVRAVGTDASRTSIRCSDGVVVDTVLPSVPTLIAPADASSVTQPFLAVHYSDLHSDGYADFQVCPTAACTTFQATGSSSLTAMEDEANWLPSLPAGTWYWRARARDLANNTTAWSQVWSFTLNNRPTSTQSSPSASAWVMTANPTFVSSYSDPDGQAGRVRFEFCRSNPAGDWSSPVVCPTGYQTVLSPSGPSGSSKSAAPATPLGEGTWYWRSWGIDSAGATGIVTAGRIVRVDTITPTDITNVGIARSGLGKVTVTWNASTDAGSGGIRYDVEWSADGITYSPVCTSTLSLTCTKTGIAGAQLPFFRIRGCDVAGNCTSWDGRLGGSASGYFLRTTTPSGVLVNAANQRATLTSGTADTLTKQQYDTGETGWMQLYPGVTSTANPVATEPAGVPAPSTGRGWIIDETGGATLAAGSWSMTVTSDTPTSSGAARLQCRAWIVTVVGASITASTNYQAAYTDLADLYSFGQRTHTCTLPGLASQTTLAADQYVYAELYIHSTVATTVNAQMSIWAEGTGSAISIPPPGTAPNTPTPIAPADGSLGSSTPSLQAQYSHPTPVSGALQFEVSTDAGFTSIVRNATSALVTSGSTGTAVLGALPAGATYYWRVRARDSSDLVSGWSTPRSFIVTTAPAVPTHQAPASGSTTTDDTPTLDASAFSDGDAGDSHGASQFQVAENGTAFAAGMDSGVLGPVDTWTTPALAGGDWWWRVRYRDSFGSWSGWSAPTSFTVQAASLTLALSTNDLDLGLQSTGVDTFGSVTATVMTTNPSGYDLTVRGAATGTAGSSCSCATPVEDWSGTDLVPSVWSAASDGFLGITVRDATDGRMAKWGAGTGTPEADVDANRYAGVATTDGLLHDRATAAASDSVVVTVRLSPSTTTSATAHTETLTFTAVPNP